jgi:flagellar motor protein MotB
LIFTGDPAWKLLAGHFRELASMDLALFTYELDALIEDVQEMVEQAHVAENAKLAEDLSKMITKGKLTGDAETSSLRDVQQAIQKALNPGIERHEVSMSMRPDRLAISLKEIGFFDSGTATIRPDALDAISRLAAVLKQRPENLRIEGHTDDVPIHNLRFASNWPFVDHAARTRPGPSLDGRIRRISPHRCEWHHVGSLTKSPG